MKKSFASSLLVALSLMSFASAQAAQSVTIPVKGNLTGQLLPGGGGGPTPGATSSASPTAAASTATVILRLFDREFGGLKLYEERQTVDVRDGIFVAYVGNGTPSGVSASITTAHPTVYAEYSLASSPGIVMEARQTIMHTRSGAAPTAISVAVDVSLCYTCGGAYPIFSGSFTNGSTRVTERGAACSLTAGGSVGTLTSRTDSSPYLCSR